jgi:hypothetical protein
VPRNFEIRTRGQGPGDDGGDDGGPDPAAWPSVLVELVDDMLAGELELRDENDEAELEALRDLIASGDIDPDSLHSRPVLDEQTFEQVRAQVAEGRTPEEQLGIYAVGIAEVYLGLLELALWRRYGCEPWEGRPERVTTPRERVRELLVVELDDELRDLRDGTSVTVVDRDHVSFMSFELESRLRRFYGIGGPSVADYPLDD